MKCFNRNVLVGLAAAGLAVYLVAPSAFSAALPLLVVLACPLGMVFMMRGMRGQGARSAEEGQSEPVTSAPPSAETEIVRLRAELDQLKAEKSGLPAPESAVDERS